MNAHCLAEATAAVLRNQARVHLCYEVHFGEPWAPLGPGDIFALRVVPNTVMDNRDTHAAKTKRQKALWPELEVVAWPNSPGAP